MKTLQELISRQITKGFFAGAILCVLSWVSYSIYSIKSSTQQAELLILNQAGSLAESAVLSQDLYAIQKEVGRFVESLNQTQPYSSRIEVWMNQRLIASAGDLPSVPILATRVAQALPTNSGSSFEVVGIIDHTKSLKKFTLMLFAVLVATGLIIAVMRRLIFHSLSQITNPLSALIGRIERMSRSLPSSIDVGFEVPKETTIEVAALNTAVATFISEINGLHLSLSKVHSENARFEMASQVAHDIRSPLAALEMVTQMTEALPEDTRLIIRSAVGRIRDIANSLLLKNREQTLSKGKVSSENFSPDEPKSLQLLSSVMDVLVTEKRMQYRSKLGVEIQCNLDQASYGLFSDIQLGEFKRVLSNLINNAVEGLGAQEQGRVSIQLSAGQSAKEVLLCIEDTGKGIPQDLIARLGQRGETHGKMGGSGLGLFHARTSVESWGGSLAIESQVGVGTRILITLPRSPAPDWFVPILRVSPQETIVILDDDTSIHQIWRERFCSFTTVNLVHCSTPHELVAWHSQNAGTVSSVTYLCDYELIGYDKTGLDTIEHLGIGKRSILVTSRFEEIIVRDRCEKLGVRLIPKGMAGFVTIEANALDAILIDDDELVHMNWKYSAKKLGKGLKTFYSAEEFLAVASDFDPATPIYIDSNLKDGVKGEEVAKVLYGLRFDSIYLATGYNASTFAKAGLPHIRGIQGKEPPWVTNDLA